jgi:hypothetical protein
MTTLLPSLSLPAGVSRRGLRGPGQPTATGCRRHGFLNLFNLTVIGISILPNKLFIPAASGVLGGLSVATLVMMLTLRSIRRGDKGETPTEAGTPAAF